MFARSTLTLGTSIFASALAIGAMALSASPAQAAEEPLFAVLNGNNECNGAGPPAGPICRLGDRDAFGSATILISQAPGAAMLCFGITVDNLDTAATAAHIHSGNASFNGPVVINLAPPVGPAASNPGASSGCVPIAAATAASIVANPTRFYINVHNAGFPGGAVRGQLF
jgi:hypothetical protein